MSKSLKHYKKQHNKSRRLRKRKGGRPYSAAEFALDQLKGEMKDGQHLFAMHSRDSCTYCKQMKPAWERVVERLSHHPRLTVAKLGPDATDYMNDEYYSKHNYGVNGVPTIVYYIVNKKAPHEYDGKRTADEIIKWLTKIMKENNLELTIKPKTDEDVEQPVSFEQPAEKVPESQGDEQLEAPPSESAPAFAPASGPGVRRAPRSPSGSGTRPARPLPAGPEQHVAAVPGCIGDAGGAAAPRALARDRRHHPGSG